MKRLAPDHFSSIDSLFEPPSYMTELYFATGRGVNSVLLDEKAALALRSERMLALCVLDYMIISNHVHLLVKDAGSDVIAQSVHRGRTDPEYNQPEQSLVREKRGGKRLRWAVRVSFKTIKSELGSKSAHREVIEVDGTYALREEGKAYEHEIGRENETLRFENTQYWNDKRYCRRPNLLQPAS